MFTNPFSFDGRIRRTEFGISLLLFFVLYGGIFGIVYEFFFDFAEEKQILIFLILFIPLLWFTYAQGAKRCHDLEKSGWWQLIPFYLFIMLFQEGESRHNKFGQNPKLAKPDITYQNAESQNTYNQNPQITSQFQTPLIIPNTCPHCNNPNNRKTRLCEWCGSQIC